MICRVENTTNSKLKDYISEFGQQRGLLKFIREESGTTSTEEDFATGIPESKQEETGMSKVAQHLNRVLRSRQNRLNNINADFIPLNIKRKRKSLSQEERTEYNKLKQNRDSLLESIKELKGEIEKIEGDSNLQNMQQIAHQQLGWVNSTLEKNEIHPSEYQEMSNILDLWSGIKDVMYARDEELTVGAEKILTDIQNKVNGDGLTRKWLNSIGEYLATVSGYKDSKSLLEEFYKLKDIAFWRGNVMSTADTGVRLISETDKIIRNSLNKADLERLHWRDRLKGVFDKLKEAGLDGEFTHLTWQVNSEGNPTGDMVGEYAQLYWDNIAKVSKGVRNAFSELNKNPDSSSAKKKVKAAVKRKHKWLNENTIQVDVRYFDNPNIEPDGKSFNTHKQDLERILGKEKAQEVIEAAKERYEEFKDTRDNIELGYSDEIDTGIITLPEGKNKEEHLSDLMLEWDLKNSPEVWFNQGDKTYTGEYTQHYNKWSYLIPRKYKNTGEETGYYDKNYQKIMSSPEMRNAFEQVKEFMDNMMAYVPAHLKQDVQSNFLPKFKKSLIKDFTLNDSLGAVTTLFSDWKDSLTSKQGMHHNEIDPTTGKPYKNIPLQGLSSIEAGERSLDLERVLMLFGDSALLYKHRAQTLDTVNLVNHFLDTMSKDSKRKEFTGDELNNLRNLMDYTVEALFYENAKKEEGVWKNVRVYKGKVLVVKDPTIEKEVNKKYKAYRDSIGEKEAFKRLQEEYGSKIELVSQRKKWKTIQDQMADLQEKLFEEKITEEQYKEEIKPLEEEANTIGKSVTASRIADAGMKLIQAQAFWFNPFSAFNNYMFGITSLAMWGHGGRDFSTRDFRKSFGLIGKSMFSLKDKRMDKVANLITRFNALSTSRDFKTEGVNESLNKIKNFPYVLLTKGDYFIKGQTLIALMLGEKITTKTNNTISLYEAFDDNGKWRRELFDEEVNNKWDGEALEKKSLEEHLRFKNKADTVIRKLHGNFDKLAPARYKNFMFGRMLGQFRFSWLSVGVEQRFGKRQFDSYLNREVEGRYMTAANLGVMKSLSVLSKLAVGSKRAFEGIRAQDREIVAENMRKNLMEIYIYSLLFGVMVTMKHMSKGGDEDDYKYRLVYNMLWRVMGETTFYLSPKTFIEIVRDPLPILQLAKRANGVYTGAMDLLFEPDMSDSERKRSIAKLTNTFPALNNLNKFTYATQKLR